MTRTQTITVMFWLTLICVGTAVTKRMLEAPAGPPGRDTLVMISPLFFGMAAKRASHLGRVATFVAFIGLAFGSLAVYAAFDAPAKPGSSRPAGK